MLFIRGSVYLVTFKTVSLYPMLTSSTNGAGWVTALCSNH